MKRCVILMFPFKRYCQLLKVTFIEDKYMIAGFSINNYILFLVISFFVVFSQRAVVAQSFDNNKWELEKNKKGIKIYTRCLEGSKLKEFKAYTEFNTPINNLLQVLMDLEYYSDWTENLKHSEILENVNDNELIIYSLLKTPWPVNNRDVVNRIEVERSENQDAVVLKMATLNKFLREKRGIIRMPKAEGGWRILRVADNRLSVEYYFNADPGGNIPFWLVNMFIVDGPFKTLNNLKDYLKINLQNKVTDENKYCSI